MLGTNFFYPYVLIVSLGAVVYSFSKLKFSKRDWKPLTFLLGISMALLFLNTPHIIVFGEFFYMEGGEYFANNLFKEDFQPFANSRPLGLSFFYIFPIKLGLSAFTSAHLVNLVFHLLSPLILFLAMKTWKGPKIAMTSALIFILNFTWLRLQKTAVSEISSTFFLLLSVLFFIKYVKRGGYKLPFVASLSFFFHIRPENFLIALPFLAFFIFNELKSRPSKNTLLLLLFLIFNFGFASFHMLSKTSHQLTWELDYETRVNFFKSHLADNLHFFTTLPFFNILLFLVMALTLFKRKRPDKVSSVFLLSFLIDFLVLTSFNFGNFLTTTESAIRYSALPMTLLLIFLTYFLEEGVLLKLLVIFSAFLLLFPQLYYDNSTNELLERLHASSYFLSSQKIIFSPPGSLIPFYPNKTILDTHCDCQFFGEYLLIRHPFENLVYGGENNLKFCNKTLLSQEPLFSGNLSIFNISCS